MACQNCSNGCAEIISDRCVRYTGINIPSLGITTGDSLSDIEQSLTDFLLSVMAGTGIHPVIDPDIICNLVGKYLPACGDLTVVDFITALIKASCDLQEQVIDLDQAVATIEADYNIGCLATVTASSGTHAILQAVIVALCQTNVTLAALSLAFDNLFNYPNAELDAYLAQYLIDHSSATTLVSNKMIPYVAYPYFTTDLSHFNANGEGTGDWLKIYLCNGYGGKTPDMRGRVPIAATDCPGPGIIDTAVLPGGFNPSYIVGGVLYGTNSITLSAAQGPVHTHGATSTATVPPHYHYEFGSVSTDAGLPVAESTYPAYQNVGPTTFEYTITGNNVTPTLGRTSSSQNVIITPTVTVASAGTGNAHANNQPAIACQFIMYVP